MFDSHQIPFLTPSFYDQATDLLLVRQTTTLWGNNKTLWNISSAFVVSVGPFEDALKLHEACGVGSTISGGSGAEGGVGGGRVLEDQWPSPPRRRAPVAPNEEQLRREPWYHSRMSRRDAEKLLSRDGDFLVRESTTNPGQYVLSGLHRGLPKHLLLVDPEGVVSLLRSSSNKSRCLFVLLWSYTGVLLLFCFSLQKKKVRTKDMLFESITHLVSFHLKNELPIVAAESELHLKRGVRRKQWITWTCVGL